MKIQYNYENYINFTLELKSRTNKGRTNEALELLKSKYPYNITSSDIYIEETKTKGTYLIYINRNGFEKNNRLLIKQLTAVLIFVFSILIISITVKIQKQNKQKELSEQKKIELQNIQKIQQAKENETKLKKLIENWTQIEKDQFDNIFERIELLYSLIGKHSTIENISIEKDSFVIDLSSKDSVLILKNFETCNKLTKVKMSRTTVANNKDLITISGDFIKKSISASEADSVETQIRFYENLIQQNEERKTQLNNQSLSLYIEQIRTLLHKNNCKEQYFQIKGDKENLEVEVLIYSTAKSILDFLKIIQQEKNNLFDIKSFRLRNSEEQNRLQTLLIFKTGISVSDNSSTISEYNLEFGYSTNEISSALYKAPLPKKIETKQNNQKSIIEKKAEAPKIQKSVTYIGLTKKDGKSYIMVKTNDMNVIYKLLIVTEEQQGNFCLETTPGSYVAKIHNEWYEVKK